MIDVRNMNVFLSGPMSGIRNNNAGAFAEAHAALKVLGAAKVFDPALEWLTESSDGQKGHEHYMRTCVRELTRPDSQANPFYDMLVTLPGWEGSDGSRTEVMVAEACGIEVRALEEVADDGCGGCQFQGACDGEPSDLDGLTDVISSIVRDVLGRGDED